VKDLDVLENGRINLDALRNRLDFLEECIREAPVDLRELMICDPNVQGLHGVILGLSAEDLLVNCKNPDDFVIYLNRQAEAHFGSGFSEMFAEYHEEDRSARLYDRKHAEDLVRLHPEAFQSVAPWKGKKLDFSTLSLVNPFSEASALLSGFPVKSLLTYKNTEYGGYFPPKDFLWSLYNLQMYKPENQALGKALEDYENNGFRQMVRDPQAFEKHRQDLEKQMKAAFEPAVATIDDILDDRKKAINHVEEDHEIDRVRGELWGQPTHARYLFEKIIVSGQLDWLRPPNGLVSGSGFYRLDKEGAEHLARIDDALKEVGYFERMGVLKKRYCP